MATPARVAVEALLQPSPKVDPRLKALGRRGGEWKSFSGMHPYPAWRYVLRDSGLSYMSDQYLCRVCTKEDVEELQEIGGKLSPMTLCGADYASAKRHQVLMSGLRLTPHGLRKEIVEELINKRFLPDDFEKLIGEHPRHPIPGSKSFATLDRFPEVCNIFRDRLVTVGVVLVVHKDCGMFHDYSRDLEELCNDLESLLRGDGFSQELWEIWKGWIPRIGQHLGECHLADTLAVEELLERGDAAVLCFKNDCPTRVKSALSDADARKHVDKKFVGGLSSIGLHLTDGFYEALAEAVETCPVHGFGDWPTIREVLMTHCLETGNRQKRDRLFRLARQRQFEAQQKQVEAEATKKRKSISCRPTRLCRRVVLLAVALGLYKCRSGVLQCRFLCLFFSVLGASTNSTSRAPWLYSKVFTIMQKQIFN